MKKIILAWTLVCLALVLFSCNPTSSCQHADENLDGICDQCENEMPGNEDNQTHTHALIHVEATASGCTTEGTMEHWMCSGCDKLFADANAETELTSVTIPATHTGGTEKRNEKEATAYQNGYTGDTWCLGCETMLAEGEEIPCLDHLHELVRTYYVNETCESDGNIDYYTCSVCNKIYSNEGGTEEITLEDTILPGGHKYDTEWTTTVIAHWHASQCGHENKDYGLHEFVDGVCVECGYHQVLASPTLTYALNPDSASYSVTGSTDLLIKELVIPALYEGLPVTEIASHAFIDCDYLETISFAEAHNLIKIGGYAFDSYTLKTIYFGEESSIEVIEGYAFYHCRGFEEIIIRSSALKTIGTAAFGGCGELIRVVIDSTELTTIGSSAFEVCTNLQSVDLSSSTKLEYIDMYAFDACSSLREINLPLSSLKNVHENAFRGCNEVLYTEYANGIYVKVANNPYAILIGTVENSQFTHFGVHESTKNIAYGAMKDATTLTTIYLPEGLAGISDYAFFGCTALSQISIPDTTLYIGHCAFERCQNLSYVQITKESQLQFIGGATFYQCEKLSSIVIPVGVTVIEQQCFAYSGLKTVYYCGTASDWNQIHFGGNNVEIVEYATILYYSETNPNSTGTHWHYDENGLVVVW